MKIPRLILSAGLILSSLFVATRPVSAAEITTMEFNLTGWTQPTNASIGSPIPTVSMTGFTSSNPNINLWSTTSQYGAWYEEGATDYQPALGNYTNTKTYRYRLNLEGVKAINGDTFPATDAGVIIRLNGVNFTLSGVIPKITDNYYQRDAAGDIKFVAYSDPITLNAPIVMHNVNTDVNPVGTGTITGGGTYAAGSNVTLTPVANPGYKFISWTEGAIASTSLTFEISNLSGDRNITANFTKDYQVTVGNNAEYIKGSGEDKSFTTNIPGTAIPSDISIQVGSTTLAPADYILENDGGNLKITIKSTFIETLSNTQFEAVVAYSGPSVPMLDAGEAVWNFEIKLASAIPSQPPTPPSAPNTGAGVVQGLTSTSSIALATGIATIVAGFFFVRKRFVSKG